MGIEINRLVKLFADLEHGECWIGINFREALRGVDTKKASKKIHPDGNSIWLLVTHITYWRSRVVNRLMGSDNPPPFPDFNLPGVMDEMNWKQTLHDFESTYHILRSAILNLPEDHLEKPSPKEGQTFFELIMGCLQHDAYHLGQIILLKKYL